MNVVTLIGNLATDVEVEDVGEGKQVASFVLAVDRRGKDGAPTSFASRPGTSRPSSAPSTWRRAKRVGVDGRLRSRSWEDADGTSGTPSRSSRTESSSSRRRWRGGRPRTSRSKQRHAA